MGASRQAPYKSPAMMDGSATMDGPSRLLVIDDHETCVTGVGRTLQTLRHVVRGAATFQQAVAALQICEANHVISELRVGGRWLFDFLPELSDKVPLSQLVVATAYPSVATAVNLTRMGIAGYFAKPLSIQAVLFELGRGVEPEGSESDSEGGWPSLDRTIWEYLNQASVAAGSGQRRLEG